MKNNFIVIEGLSGSGKSAVSQKLAEMLNGYHYKAPIEPISILREYVDQAMTSQTRALYYLMSISHLSDIVDKNISKASIVVDKYIYTTIAFNKVRNVEIEIPNFIKLRKPDFIFFLEVDDNIREERISSRNNEIFKRDPKRIEKDRKVTEAFNEFPFIKINNNHSIEHSVNQILDIIHKS